MPAVPASAGAPGASMYQPTAAAPVQTGASGVPASTQLQSLPTSLDLASLYKDPTILAFLRSSGLGEQVMANEIARRQAAINQTLGTNLEDLAARGVIDRRNIGGSMEARGLYRSGENLQKQAEQEAQQARLQGSLQQQAANQVADLQGNLAMKVAENQQKAAELGTNAYIQNALAAGKGTIDQNYSGYSPDTSTADEETGY